MKSLLFILREHAHNFRRIFKMVAYNIITLNRETYLGILWSILSPAIQIGVYYMVFGLGIKHGNPVDGHPFFIWMITGLIPWFYIIQSITGGAMSLSSNSGMITRIKFRQHHPDLYGPHQVGDPSDYGGAASVDPGL